MGKLPTKLAIEALRPLIVMSLFGTGPRLFVNNDRDGTRESVEEHRGLVVAAALIQPLTMHSSAATLSYILPIHMCLPASRPK